MTKSSKPALTLWIEKLVQAGLMQRRLDFRDPRLAMRMVIGVLLALNIIAAVQVIHPFGGSLEQLESDLVRLQSQKLQETANLAKLKALADKIGKGRKEGDEFLARYFLPRHSSASLLLTELAQISQAAGIRPKAHQFTTEPLEGSDTLSLQTITGNYEGNYSDLVHFLNGLDRAGRLMIIDSMAASPTNTPGLLNINLKIHAFVQEDGTAPPAPAEGEATAVAANNQGR